MTIHESQELVDKWIKEVGVRYFSELSNMAMLTEEVGEVARPRFAARPMPRCLCKFDAKRKTQDKFWRLSQQSR